MIKSVLGVDLQTVTINPEVPDLSCAPGSQSATPGTSRTFSAAGGSGSFTWSVSPSASYTPITGSDDDFTLSCGTGGDRGITVDDDDPDTASDNCILRVVRPGFIEI